MKDSIKIGTVNLQNNKVNRNGGLREDGIDTSKLVAQHIEEEQYDILGTQELTRNFVNNITSNLVKYKLYGNYRYGSSLLAKKIPFINDFNENNNIITKDEVIEEKTEMLPWIPNNPKDLVISISKASIMPRIVTITITKNETMGVICSINTHLDYQIPSIQKRQLKFLKQLIKKYSKEYPVILTGDFNMELGTEYFDSFNDELKNMGLKRVEVNEKTNADKFENKTAIDHIFIPNDWKVINSGVKDIPYVTDHKEVYAEVKKNK
ncbi:MAG: endonuclease/exonuclease/phosphatase family protein [Bacilli bacterium]|nr:endonuclease/exonuclease/phosphatase family protein [Bacilli bacterium]